MVLLSRPPAPSAVDPPHSARVQCRNSACVWLVVIVWMHWAVAAEMSHGG